MENNGKKEKGDDTMAVATMLRKKEQARFEEVDRYIERLRKMPREEARRESVEALKRTGVLDESGKSKKKIVSWE